MKVTCEYCESVVDAEKNDTCPNCGAPLADSRKAKEAELREAQKKKEAYEREVRDYYRRKFRYVLIDEYQDTNRLQYLLMKQLVGEKGNICVVGDDDQSIYAWRGADVSNILDFPKLFPGAKKIKLEQNYRSTNKILDAANAVIAHNTQRKDNRKTV